MPTAENFSFGNYPAVTLRMENGAEATIVPRKGAHLLSLKLPLSDNLVEVIDGYREPEELAGLAWSKSAKLSPFPNRVEEGRYSYQGQSHQLPTGNRPNAIHGFVKEESFISKPAILLENAAKLELGYFHARKSEGYPFAFSMKLTYELRENGLTCTTEVRNEDENPIPYGDGWHPYFQLGTETVDDLQLQIPACRQFLVDHRMIPTEETVAMEQFQRLEGIGEQEFDTGFELTATGTECQFVLRNPGKKYGIQISMDSGEGQYRFFQLFIPPSRQSIAIEPMSCATNAFNNGFGLLVLEPGEVFRASFSVEILD